MATTIEQIARAFSGHRFTEAFPHLAANVRWVLVGSETLRGRNAVIARCEESMGYLSQVTTEFRRFKSVVGSDAVAIDSLAEYVDMDGQRSVVASCDVYEFANSEVATITSYTVEVDEEQNIDPAQVRA